MAIFSFAPAINSAQWGPEDSGSITIVTPGREALVPVFPTPTVSPAEWAARISVGVVLIVVILLLVYAFFRFMLPRIMRYLGKLVFEFKRGTKGD